MYRFKKITVILGYIWASLATLVVIATFIGNSYFSKQLAGLTGVVISPWYSGGDIIKTIDHKDYRTVIHKPVFECLFGERKTGFIQIDWEPLADLPGKIDEEISFNETGKADFRIRLKPENKNASLTIYNENVIPHMKIFRLKDKFTIRVTLRNPKK